VSKEEKEPRNFYKILAIGLVIVLVFIFMFVVASKRNLKLSEPNFVVVNEDHWWEKDTLGNARLWHVKLEIYNNEGEGWGAIIVFYKEDDLIVEQKTWQLHLNNQQSQTLEFVFERQSDRGIIAKVSWTFEYK